MQNVEKLSELIDSVDTMICDGCGVEFDVEDFKPFTILECPQCGKEDMVPGKLENYLLLKELGAGGMGIVYKGHDLGLDRDVAIKVMSKELGDDKDFVADFKKEARSAAQLNHPNIAQIYAVGETNGLNYIVMEYVPGKRLDQMIEPDRPLDQAVVLKFGIDIASGLQDASKIHLIHSDIKPENILLDNSNNAKLIDFGIASFDGSNEVKDNTIWGTPYYVSPEKVKKEHLDTRSDMYSLGTTLYHALAGIPPFEGDTPNDVVSMRFTEDPKPLHEIRPYIHPDVERIIHKTMMLNPDDRYPSYKELIKDMTETLEKLTGVRVELPKASFNNKPATQKSASKKKLVIKKGGTATPPAAENTSKADENITPTSSKSGKKIIMKKGGSNKVTIKKSAAPAEQEPETGSIDEPDSAVSATDEEESPMISDYMASMVEGGKGKHKKKKKKAKSKTSKIVTIVLLVIFVPLILGGCITGIVLWKKTEAAKAAEIARIQYIRNKENSISEIADKMQTVVDRMKEKDSTVMTEVNAAIEKVFSMTGERFSLPPLPAQTEVTAPAPGSNTVATATNAVAAAEAEETTIAAAEMETAQEQIHESVPKLQEMFKAANALKIKILDVEKLVEQAGRLGQAGTNEITKASIDSDYSKAIELANQAGRLEAEAVKDLATVQRSTASINKMKEDYDLNMADKRKAEELAAKRAAEEKARKEAEEAKQRKINNEKEQVRMSRMQYDQLIKENDYKTAARKIEREVSRNLETPEGKEFLKLQLDRLEYLEDYKAFLIKEFKKSPLHLMSMPAVTDASTLGLKLNGKLVPWSKVSAAQMLAFANHYLGGPQGWITPQTNKLKLRELAKMRLAVAIYCYEIGGPTAYPLAKEYAEHAFARGTGLPNYEDDAKKMLPEVFEASSEDIF